MTTRELRTERRAAERKAEKLERKAQRSATAASPASEIGFVSQPASNRAAINRENAFHSTGPRTPAGKLASSRNSLKHGLTGGEIIIAGEDPAAYEALRAALLAEYQPASSAEELLVIEMAQSHWLTQRAIRFQNECFTADGVLEKRLALFLRYQTTHQRAFHKALDTLTRLIKDRRKHTIGFVSQSVAAPVPEIGFEPQNAPQDPPEQESNWSQAA